MQRIQLLKNQITGVKNLNLILESFEKPLRRRFRSFDFSSR